MTTQEIRNLIAAAKTGKAIEELQKINFKDADAKNTMAMLSARFADYQRQKRLGITGGNDLNIELNKINMALLGFLDENSEETLTPSTSNQGKTKSFLTFDNFKSTIAILAGIAGILTFYFKFCQKIPENGTSNKPKTVVVYTHGKKGKQDIIEFKTTRLIVDIKNRREIANVRENGQNVFTEVTSDSIRIGIDDKEGYELKHPNRAYEVTEEPIYLEVVKKESVKSKPNPQPANPKEVIKYSSKIIDNSGNDAVGVKIYCPNCIDKDVATDKNGNFTLKRDIDKKNSETLVSQISISNNYKILIYWNDNYPKPIKIN